MQLTPSHILEYVSTANELATQTNCFRPWETNGRYYQGMIFPVVYDTYETVDDEEINTFRKIAMRIGRAGLNTTSLTVSDVVGMARSSVEVSRQTVMSDGSAHTPPAFLSKYAAQTTFRTFCKIIWGNKEVERASRQYVGTVNGEDADLRMIARSQNFVKQLTMLDDFFLFAESDMAHINEADLARMQDDLQKFVQSAATE